MIGLANTAAQLPDPLEGAGSFIVLASAEFLLRDVAHLVAYADALRGISSATLLIDASAMEPEQAASQLQALVEQAGLADDDEISMVAMIGAIEPSQRFSVRRRTSALYAQDDGGSSAGAPAFTPESLGRLRELAERSAGLHSRRPAGRRPHRPEKPFFTPSSLPLPRVVTNVHGRVAILVSCISLQAARAPSPGPT